MKTGEWFEKLYALAASERWLSPLNKNNTIRMQ